MNLISLAQADFSRPVDVIVASPRKSANGHRALVCLDETFEVYLFGRDDDLGVSPLLEKERSAGQRGAGWVVDVHLHGELAPEMRGRGYGAALYMGAAVQALLAGFDGVALPGAASEEARSSFKHLLNTGVARDTGRSLVMLAADVLRTGLVVGVSQDGTLGHNTRLRGPADDTLAEADLSDAVRSGDADVLIDLVPDAGVRNSLRRRWLTRRPLSLLGGKFT